MKKTAAIWGLIMMLVIVLSACGGNNKEVESGKSENEKPTKEAATEAPTSEGQAKTKIIKYLEQEYELPASTERIVITGAVEAMEDSIVLDVNPVGAITFSGKFPPMFASITEGTESVGEKIEPNFEKILSLKPDVILASTKFKPEVVEQLKKIGPTIPYSHVSTNWKANLELLGELTGKKEKAIEAITQYEKDLEGAKVQLSDKLKDKKVVVARVREGELYIYPEAVYFNPVIYEELGASVPAEIKAAKAQELLSVEKLAEMNPDYLFLQFSPDENRDTPKALEDLQKNPIIKNINAFKNGAAYTNVVDPLAQGGTAYSKIEFLKAIIDNLSK